MALNQSSPDILAEQRREIMGRYQSLMTPTNIYQIQGPNATAAGGFPVQLGTMDPTDEKWQLRNQIVNPQGQVPGVGQAYAPDEYFDWAKRKQDEATTNEFIAWLMQQADYTRPEVAKYWNDLFPWIGQLKMQEVRKQADLQVKMAEMNINGLKSPLDWQIAFMVQQGLLRPLEVPIQDMYKQNRAYQTSYVAGLFSPGSQIPNMLPKSDKVNMMNWSYPMAPLGGATQGAAASTTGWLTNTNLQTATGSLGSLWNFGRAP